MKFDTVRIISWFGNKNNEKLVNRRKEIHKQQIEFFQKYGFRIIVYAQEYDTEDYMNGVEYIVNVSDRILKPGEARNILLKDFYDSNEDYCFFCDNDSTFYDFKDYHSDGVNISEIIRNGNIGDWLNVAVIRPIYPRLEPYSEHYYKNKFLIDNNITLKKTIMLKGSAFIMQNLKKHHNIEHYFDDSPLYKDDVWYGGEDILFGADLLMMNLGVFKSNNFVLKEVANENARTWTEKQGVDALFQKQMMELIDIHLKKKYNLTRKEITTNSMVNNMCIPKSSDSNLELFD